MSEATLARFTCPNCHVVTDLIQHPDAIKSALAAERRATVERIRAACIKTRGSEGEVHGYIWRILDEEADR